MNRLMKNVLPSAAIVFLAAGATTAFVRASDESPKGAGDHEAPCNIQMTRALYGFQCSGSLAPNGVLEPVSFVGTVRGDGRGFFEGFGTLNSSNGSAHIHNAGRGTVLPSCSGHVDYTTNEIVLPNGTISLPTISFDFAVVHGGDELLGAGVVPPGVTGDIVPRLSCHLVRTR